MNNVARIWSQVMEKLGTTIPEKDLACWLGSIRPVGWEHNRFVAELPSGIHRERVRHRFHEGIRQALHETVGGEPDVVYAVRPRPASRRREREKTCSRRNASLPSGSSFETFVVGNSNEEAFRHAREVGESSVENGSVLLLCGTVGLGKTHLLCAIRRRIHQRMPQARVEMLSAERFVNEVVDACRGGRKPDISKRLESLDVLLLDDLPFVAGKRRCQEELASVVEALRRRNRIVVVASDRRPAQLPALDGRTRSCLETGHVVSIGRPEAELRARILHAKAQASGFELAGDVARWIASRIVTNVRELEGALTRLIAAGEMLGALPDLAFARRVLEPILPEPRGSGCLPVLEQVAECFQVGLDELRSPRKGGAVLARKTAMYLLRRGTGSTYGEIGRACGGRTASAALQAVRSIETKRATDSEFAALLADLETDLGIV